MLDPLISEIEVPCDKAKAFDVFVNSMPNWWPLDKRAMSKMNGQNVKELKVDGKLGGQIVEISEDGTEYHWGTFTTFDPNDILKMDFHMGLPADNASHVEVVFSDGANGGTQVRLTQSNFEGFGDMAEMMRGGYGSGWVIIFEEGFKNACS